jgi:hypothetical protein
MVGMAELLASPLSVSNIGRSYGSSRQAISAKAKREKWPPWGALVDEDRKEFETLLLEGEGVTAGVTPLRGSWNY